MPKQSAVTPALVCEVAERRLAGEPWKAIAADMRRRGLPADRASWWRCGVLGVAQRLANCEQGPEACKA